MDILVLEMCQINFSIGKHYTCEVLCDVLDMDVCHVILGRPWQFDVGAIYDGKANTYSLEWKGKRLRLLSQATSNASKTADVKSAMHIVNGNTLMSSSKERSLLFSLIIKEETPLVLDRKLALEVDELLGQFKDIISDSVPAALPSLRALQHQIDFVPGATLPNLPHHRLSPNEHQILHQLVDELLEKKLIQPSLSPCAVPALMVPKKDGS
ncbi:hypothetical protein KFK09_019458 [Dendrobium nobile]|uniref:Uncharacterized protein n=1 Tax=Dendrobium nobile TaxID=94219 RepID=A0A8T3AR10_DENNO|nr:hypothetical protein KFK09_019458 [Dendrobium nobile]